MMSDASILHLFCTYSPYFMKSLPFNSNGADDELAFIKTGRNFRDEKLVIF